MSTFLNASKEERARKVVAKPDLFERDSVEITLLSKLDPKLSDEEKVVAIYKGMGGLLLEDAPEQVKVAAKKGKK